MILFDLLPTNENMLVVQVTPPHQYVSVVLDALPLVQKVTDDTWVLPVAQFLYLKRELDTRGATDGREVSGAAYEKIQAYLLPEQDNTVRPPPPPTPGPKNYLPGGVEREFLALVFQNPTAVRLGILCSTKAQWLQTPAYQWLLDEKTLDFVKEYNRLPPHDWIWERLQKDKAGSDYIEYANTICAVYNHKLTRAEDAEKQFVNHVTMMVVLDGVRTAQEGFKNTESAGLVIEHLDSILQSARQIFSRPEVYDFTSQFEARRDKRISKKNNPKDFRLTLGIDKIDKQLKIVPGTVTGFIAPFKKFKSIVLGHIVWAAAVQGLPVALFNFENPLEMVVNRLDSRFTFLDYDKMSSAELSALDDDSSVKFMQWIATRMPNRVKVIPCQPKVTTVQACSAILQQAYHTDNFNPAVIVFDYANLVGANVPKNARWEERLVQEQIVWDMQALAKGKLPGGSGDQRAVITAFQTNMQGVDADRLKRSHIGKAIGIMQGVDNAIGINQDRQEALDKEIVFSFLAARDSAIEVEEVKVKHELWRMNIAEESTQFWQKLLAENKVG